MNCERHDLPMVTLFGCEECLREAGYAQARRDGWIDSTGIRSPAESAPQPEEE